MPRFKGIATAVVEGEKLVEFRVELLPRFKGIATERSTTYLINFEELNFCPASRGLRLLFDDGTVERHLVELLPRFKGIAT